MKKTILIAILAMTAVLNISATDYNGKFDVKVGENTATNSNVFASLEKGSDDKKYILTIKNVSAEVLGDTYSLGNIVVKDIELGQDGSFTSPKTEYNNIIITEPGELKDYLNYDATNDNYGMITTATGTVKDGKLTISIPGTVTFIYYGISFQVDITFVYTGDEVPTGISSVPVDETKSDSKAYNFAGQRINDGSRGLIIKNGKKYIAH